MAVNVQYGVFGNKYGDAFQNLSKLLKTEKLSLQTNYKKKNRLSPWGR